MRSPSERNARRWLVAGGLIALLLAGCGEEDIGAQNERIASELYFEIEGASSGSEGSVPRDVACVRPMSGRFRCTAYVAVREDVAVVAEYRVRECEAGWRARRISAHSWLEERLPLQVRHARDPNFDCPWVR